MATWIADRVCSILNDYCKRCKGVNVQPALSSTTTASAARRFTFDEQDYQAVASWIISHNDNAKNTKAKPIHLVQQVAVDHVATRRMDEKAGT